MPGYVDGEFLRQLYSHARLFVLPSYNEGFPLVLLEAMSYHLPILASDIPANKLLELNPGDYFKTGDALDLSKHINKNWLKNLPELTIHSTSIRGRMSATK